MIFEVAHTTRFSYSRPIFLEPMTVRLRPRSDVTQRLLRFEISASPPPADMFELTDAEGNGVAKLWFNGLTDGFMLQTAFAVETLLHNPFEWVVLDPAAIRLPMTYPKENRAVLAPYRIPSGDPAVSALAHEVSMASGGTADTFLTALSSRVYDTIEQEFRSQGDALPPAVTLARHRGPCRDLALLFMDACRSLGLASRYVSGYELGELDAADRELHAWAEVYVTGAGWRGYDPSQGLAVADRHVAVAVGAAPAGAAPTGGVFWGTGVTSCQEARIEVRTVRD